MGRCRSSVNIVVALVYMIVSRLLIVPVKGNAIMYCRHVIWREEETFFMIEMLYFKHLMVYVVNIQKWMLWNIKCMNIFTVVFKIEWIYNFIKLCTKPVDKTYIHQKKIFYWSNLRYKNMYIRVCPQVLFVWDVCVCVYECMCVYVWATGWVYVYRHFSAIQQNLRYSWFIT